MLLSGRDYSGKEAEQAGIVDESTPQDRVYSRAYKIASSLAESGKHRAVLKTIKEEMNKAPVQAALTSSEKIGPKL